ncbi:MAG: phenylalanine--tRNA ligase subunit alpha [bacterium]
MNPNDYLSTIQAEVSRRLAAGESPDQLRQEILGRKGELTLILRSLSTLPLDERASLGQKANLVRDSLEVLLTAATGSQAVSTGDLPDITVPEYPVEHGTIHPISAMVDELVAIFEDLSFEVVEGNEIVSDRENFENLNMDKDHPARDGHDTFYIDPTTLLRTQTSAIQVNEMKKRMKTGQMPIRIIAPGKTYRRDSDATHSPMFHQLEGLLVDTQTTFSDLKGILAYVAQRLFGDDVETRFRTHFFPYTEPSAEVDIRWKNGNGEGKHMQWIEWFGCGMVHPKVLERAGINPKVYQGWAFGIGIERPIMVRHQVPDMRILFENSRHFLDQFGQNL